MIFLLSVATFVVGGALFALVERRYAVRPRRRLAAALAQDLPYVVLSNALPGYIVSRLGALAAGPLADQPFALQWLVVLAITELTFYALHRAFHTVPALWWLHAPHHAPTELDWLAGSRKHIGEALLHGLLPVPALLALGPSPEVMLAHALLGTFATGFTHWNARFALGWLDELVVTPRYHAWHHAVATADQRTNLAGKLAVFDRVFGTRSRAAGWPEHLGGERAAEGWLATHRRSA